MVTDGRQTPSNGVKQKRGKVKTENGKSEYSGKAINGFIAYLLSLKQQWDPRCSQADMQDYHSFAKRM